MPRVAHAVDYSRPLPKSHHPGAVRLFQLDADEELQWRRWSPRVNDMVLVELQDGTIWPAKVGFITNERQANDARSSTRRCSSKAAALYREETTSTLSGCTPKTFSRELQGGGRAILICRTMTIKSRMIPLELRPSPPLLASTDLLSAYNHALNPTAFDAVAANREQAAAYARTHPGAGDEDTVATLAAEKEKWKKFVNWLMDERRVEKLRNLGEERDKRLREVTSTFLDGCNGDGCGDEATDGRVSRKRRVAASIPVNTYTSTKTIQKLETDATERGGIFRIAPLSGSPTSTQGSSGSSRCVTPMASYIRPALSVPHRPNSPRRADRRRNGVLTGIGEFSPRSRGLTYTPPRVLPSGDETAPFTPSPAPSLKSFDFCSPFGTKYKPNDDDIIMVSKNGSMGSSLEAVREEDGEEGDWTVVVTRSRRGIRSRRAGSEPCEKAKAVVPPPAGMGSDDMAL